MRQAGPRAAPRASRHDLRQRESSWSTCLTRVSRCEHTSELVPRHARADRRPRWNSLIYKNFQCGAHGVAPSVLVRLADLSCPDALSLSARQPSLFYCNLQDKECQSEAEWNEFA